MLVLGETLTMSIISVPSTATIRAAGPAKGWAMETPEGPALIVMASAMVIELVLVRMRVRAAPATAVAAAARPPAAPRRMSDIIATILSSDFNPE